MNPGIVMVLLVVAMVILLGVGVANRARHAGENPRLGVGVAIAITLWLALVAALAKSGALATTSVPPRWPFLPLAAVVAIVIANRTRAAQAIIRSTPLHWPIALQSFRIVVELVLYALHEAGIAPVQITFEGRNFDILVGLTAPFVAWLVARRKIGNGAVLAWNLAGLAILANTVGTVATSTPGPLHLDWPGAPFTALTTWPAIWLPSFLVPVAVCLHVVSIMQTRAARAHGGFGRIHPETPAP